MSIAKTRRWMKVTRRATATKLATVLLFFALAALVGAVTEAWAVNVALTLDTSAFAGTGRLEFTLLPFDDLDANNAATIASPQFLPPVSLIDPATDFRDLTLGGLISLGINVTSNFDASLGGLGGPDELSVFLLDPATNFTLVDTNLAGDAVAILQLVGGGIIEIAVATSTQPPLPLAVPEPGSVVLLAAGLLGLTGASRARRTRRRFERSRPMRAVAAVLALLLVVSGAPGAWAASHREAPITALDHKADITDFYAFRSYGANQNTVNLVLDVDPFLEPSNGPTYFPFDDEVLYAIHVDHDNDALEDVTFEIRFRTETGRIPGLFQAYAGVNGGAVAPSNSPPPVPPGTPIVPPRITSLTGPGAAGINTRQTYTVTLVLGRGAVAQRIPLRRSGNAPLFAVPTNVGPRTMDYPALFNEGIYSIGAPGISGIRVWAGTADDPFWIDLGAAFDTFNLRSTVAPGALSAAQDAAQQNFASDAVSGFNVNAIAIEVPIRLLTRTGQIEPATSVAATVGTWGTTSRPRSKVLPSTPGGTPTLSTNFTQIQRMGNPLVNELLVGTELKNKWSMSRPKDDAQFAAGFLDPLLARVINALTNGAVAIPPPPRFDLLPLVTYAPPICPACGSGNAGPIADLLRLNTGVPPTPAASASRLGVLGGDSAGFPNGRRLFDDVTDITLRVVVGGVLAAPFPGFNAAVNGRLGDGVNVNDVPYHPDFPYLGFAHSGRDRRHIDPGEPGCTMDAGPACPE